MTIIMVAAPIMPAAGQEQERHYDQANSRSQYVHHIDLYDAQGKIDPTSENARPYSPSSTCMKCHNYDAISHGWHFNAADKGIDHGRPGEPWIWTHRRAGTQIPMSFRGWPGTYRPEDVQLNPMEFLMHFGRHQPGGGIGEREPVAAPKPKTTPAPKDGAKTQPATTDGSAATDETDSPAKPAPDSDPDSGKDKSDKSEPVMSAKEKQIIFRWKVTGRLTVDCMLCHSAARNYSHERWAQQVGQGNFAWAPSVALGLAKVIGSVRSVPKDYDPDAETDEKTAKPKMPRTVYNQSRFDSKHQVFFDIVRKPTNNSCYACHSVRQAGHDAPPKWQHDQDVHIKAGMSCVDCHRNGIGHNTVRGYEGEKHPTGKSVVTLSCRGCHLGGQKGKFSGQAGGRLGSPKPLHKGLPPLHFEKMSCTSCHSGPVPGKKALAIETSFSHALGLAQDRQDDDPPYIVAPVFIKNADGVLYPHRMTWPAFWGQMKDDQITPLNSDAVYKAAIRRPLRVRARTLKRHFEQVTLDLEDKEKVLPKDRAAIEEEKLTKAEIVILNTLKKDMAVKEFRSKLVDILTTIKEKLIEDKAAVAVYVAGGKVYKLDKEGKAIETIKHKAAEPYSWPVAHDVRPARRSLGVKGCTECHSAGAPIFYSEVTALAPVPDDSPITTRAYEIQQLDPDLLKAWNQSFKGRSAFKVFALIAMGLLTLVLVLHALLGLNGLVKRLAGGNSRPSP